MKSFNDIMDSDDYGNDSEDNGDDDESDDGEDDGDEAVERGRRGKRFSIPLPEQYVFIDFQGSLFTHTGQLWECQEKRTDIEPVQSSGQ